jgi:hypothetical protein
VRVEVVVEDDLVAVPARPGALVGPVHPVQRLMGHAHEGVGPGHRPRLGVRHLGGGWQVVAVPELRLAPGQQRPVHQRPFVGGGGSTRPAPTRRARCGGAGTAPGPPCPAGAWGCRRAVRAGASTSTQSTVRVHFGALLAAADVLVDPSRARPWPLLVTSVVVALIARAARLEVFDGSRYWRDWPHRVLRLTTSNRQEYISLRWWNRSRQFLAAMRTELSAPGPTSVSRRVWTIEIDEDSMRRIDVV